MVGLLVGAMALGACAKAESSGLTGGDGGTSPGATASSSSVSSTTGGSTTTASSSTGDASSSTDATTGSGGAGGAGGATSSTSTSTSSSSGAGGSTNGGGDTCADASVSPITASGTYTGTLVGAGSDYDPDYESCDVSGEGPDVAYAVNLSAGQILNATVVGDGDLSLYVLTDCADAADTCVAGSDDGYEGDPETIQYTATTAQTIYLIVDSYDDSEASDFSLDVDIHTPVCGDGKVDGIEQCDDMNATAGDGCTACKIDAGYNCTGTPSVCTPAPPGDTCGNATVITGTQTINGTLVGFNNNYDPDPTDSGDSCTYEQPGPDVVYAIDLSEGQILNVSEPDGFFTYYLVTDCADVGTSCVGSGDDFDDLTYTAPADGRVYLIVDSFDDSDADVFTLDVTIHKPSCGDGIVEGSEECDDKNATAGDGCTACKVDANHHCSGAPSVCAMAGGPGDVCTNAIPIAASGTINGTYTGFFDDYEFPDDNNCTDFTQKGPDVVYSVSLAAGQKVKATVTPSDDQDPSLYIVTDCGHLTNTCVAGSDSGFSGDPETVSYTATAATTVYIIVDTYEEDAAGAFSLNVTLQ